MFVVTQGGDSVRFYSFCSRTDDLLPRTNRCVVITVVHLLGAGETEDFDADLEAFLKMKSKTTPTPSKKLLGPGSTVEAKLWADKRAIPLWRNKLGQRTDPEGAKIPAEEWHHDEGTTDSSQQHVGPADSDGKWTNILLQSMENLMEAHRKFRGNLDKQTVQEWLKDARESTACEAVNEALKAQEKEREQDKENENPATPGAVVAGVSSGNINVPILPRICQDIVSFHASCFALCFRSGEFALVHV